MSKVWAMRILKTSGKEQMPKQAVGPNDPEVTTWYSKIIKAVKDEMANRNKLKGDTVKTPAPPKPAPAPKTTEMAKASGFDDIIRQAVASKKEAHLGQDFAVNPKDYSPGRFTVNIWDIQSRKH